MKNILIFYNTINYTRVTKYNNQILTKKTFSTFNYFFKKKLRVVYLRKEGVRVSKNTTTLKGRFPP